MAPGRPGGASLNPASSAVTTGVTVRTATMISSRVGSHAHARTRGHASSREPASFRQRPPWFSVIEELDWR